MSDLGRVADYLRKQREEEERASAPLQTFALTFTDDQARRIQGALRQAGSEEDLELELRIHNAVSILKAVRS